MKKELLGGGIYAYLSEEHTFGTDAMLLSAFAAPKPRDSLVDLGCGCGIIPLLILRDHPTVTAVGIDISEQACHQAEAAAKEQQLPFSVLCGNLKDLKGKIPFGCHTLVTCNPPYKAPGAGIRNPEKEKAVARHEVACTLEDIVSVGAKLLQTGGRLCMCQRPERLSELLVAMHDHGVEPKRLRLVCKCPGTEPWLVLVEGRRCGNQGLRIEPPLFTHENDGPSEEMLKIYGSYRTKE